MKTNKNFWKTETHQQVFPVLHEEHIRLIHNQKINRRQEVKVSLLITVDAQNCAQTQWRRNDNVRGVERRIETHAALHDRHTCPQREE